MPAKRPYRPQNDEKGYQTPNDPQEEKQGLFLASQSELASARSDLFRVSHSDIRIFRKEALKWE